MKRTQERIPRFDGSERSVHWLTALGFIFAALSGLALWSHKLYWLASLFGGGPAARVVHPWAGVVFALALAAMFRRWSRQMRWDAGDRVWMRHARRYAVHDETGLPEAGRFNAGQKSLFWLQTGAATLLAASGLVLWWPAAMPRGARMAAILIHPVAAIASIAGIILHIYMGTAAVPEAFRGMIQGWVRPGWAKSHHPRWYREIEAEDRQRGRSAGTG